MRLQTALGKADMRNALHNAREQRRDQQQRVNATPCYRRDWLKTENKRTAALIWDGLVQASRMRAS
jgi:hypothetical protein